MFKTIFANFTRPGFVPATLLNMQRFIAILLISIPFFANSQDLSSARKTVDTLTSETFWGRGYTNDGMNKAGAYLSSQFASYGLIPMSGSGFQQKFSYPVNTFPGSMSLSINGKQLMPGKDFIISPESKSSKSSGSLQQIDSVQFASRPEAFVVVLQDKLTWDVAPKEAPYTVVLLDKKALGGDLPKTFNADIENKFIKKFNTANICGMVKGTSRPDSFIMITAHYDHLGGMGDKTYFPGANDNASGIALLLNLAKYYAAHPQPYSIGFICFAGEEAGLLGSDYFTKNPLVPLKSIRFLTNTDLAGTGEEGITVVNATEFPIEYAMMNAVNDEQKLLVKINARGKAANSDHYYFTEKGVPAFFFYTLGGIKAYHDIFDKAATLPLNEQEDLMKLVIGFNDKLMHK
jgi:aminopeptidase YwaD